MKIAVLLSGSGVYDGSEIHEAVFTLLSINEAGLEYQCIAPDKDQWHVINHIDGSEVNEKRNVLEESARIARGDIISLSDFDHNTVEALVIPGGFGAAKNLNTWAIDGANASIDENVKQLIISCIKANKPICGLCMGPTVIASALANSIYSSELTTGTTEDNSPYDIKAIHEGIDSLGQKSISKRINEIHIDEQLKIVTAPCYMMEASIQDVSKNVKQAINALIKLI